MVAHDEQREHPMNTVKQDVIKIINELPDDVQMEEIMYQLYVLDTVNKGLEDIEQGRTLSAEEVKKEIDSWS